MKRTLGIAEVVPHGTGIGLHHWLPRFHECSWSWLISTSYFHGKMISSFFNLKELSNITHLGHTHTEQAHNSH